MNLNDFCSICNMISSDLSSFGCHLSSDRWSQQLVFLGCGCVGFLWHVCHMEDSNMDTAGLCRTRFVWHVTRFDSSRSRLGLKMRIRIHLSTCSGDEDRTVFGPPKLEVANWTDRNLPREECFFLCQRNREVPFWNPFDMIDIVTIGIGSTLPTRHSTTRCRAYPVTENCRSDLSLTNGNLVNEILWQDARNDNIL